MSDKTDPRLEVATKVAAWFPIYREEEACRQDTPAERLLADLDAAAREAGYVPMLDTNDEALVERITSVLADNGVQPNTEAMHSWRCNEPDRYPNYCTCVPELVGDLIAALREAS